MNERGLAPDRAPRLVEHELAQQQVFQLRVDRFELRRKVQERALPEDSANHRGTLQKRLRLGCQPVDASRDQRLERVGDPADLCGAVLVEHPHRLLEEERVALGLRKQLLSVGLAERAVGHQRIHELLALDRTERFELDCGRADAATAPAGPDVEQLRPRERNQEKRRLAHPRRQMLDQLQERLLGPVDVLEDEHERLLLP